VIVGNIIQPAARFVLGVGFLLIGSGRVGFLLVFTLQHESDRYGHVAPDLHVYLGGPNGI
jgi:hypothetical protein